MHIIIIQEHMDIRNTQEVKGEEAIITMLKRFRNEKNGEFEKNKVKFEENGNTNVSNRDVKPRGHFKRGSYDNQKRQDKRHESEN